jgi:hypothetical protein
MQVAKYSNIGHFRYGVRIDLVEAFSQLGRENYTLSHDRKVTSFGHVTSLNGKGDGTIDLVSLPCKLDAIHFRQVT